MSVERLPSLSAAEQEAVDAFLKRFEQLVSPFRIRRSRRSRWPRVRICRAARGAI
jgi:hypothetical protein